MNHQLKVLRGVCREWPLDEEEDGGDKGPDSRNKRTQMQLVLRKKTRECNSSNDIMRMKMPGGTIKLHLWSNEVRMECERVRK